MILYNVTTLVSWPVHEEWKAWLTEIHVPAILATGLFTRYQLVKLLEVDQEGGATYALQLYAPDAAAFRTYRTEYEASFERMGIEKWGDTACSFSSVMEVIN